MASQSYRTTISIPKELKDEMDAAGEQVNWSAVAARAFRSELARIAATRKRHMTKEEVVKRLKAKQEQEMEAKGKAHGREWAERFAGPSALLRLMRWYNMRQFNENASFKRMEDLYSYLYPSGEDLQTFKAETCANEWPDVCHDTDYTAGFVDGATDVWDEVEGEL
jgi:hypothetical protein